MQAPCRLRGLPARETQRAPIRRPGAETETVGMSQAEDRRVSLNDELATQAIALLQISPHETDNERVNRIDGYRHLLGRYGTDTSGDEATLITRLGYLVGTNRGNRPSTV